MSTLMSSYKKMRRKKTGSSGSYDQEIERLQKSRPDVASTYNRAADLTTGAVQSSVDQGRASYLANEGNRGGIGSQLFAAGVGQAQMAPALAESAQLRAAGANAQAGITQSYDQLLATLFRDREAMNLQREQMKAEARRAQLADTNEMRQKVFGLGIHDALNRSLRSPAGHSGNMGSQYDVLLRKYGFI